LLYILGFFAVIGFVISGIMFLTAAGNEDQATKAKSYMIYSIVGILVALLGLIILNAAQAWLGGGNRF
jgi:multisubunit Na+/H+ antiporter MnhB subunit